MAADDGDVVGAGGGLHSLPDLVGVGLSGSPEDVGDGEGSATHGGDVAEIDHDRAVAGEPRVVGDEGFQHSFGGEKKMTATDGIGNGGAVVA